jgi:DNA invertase Pin-like site-specific DNA recombinase
VTRTYLNKVLRGKKPVGQRISRALGLRKVTSRTEAEVLQLLRREIREAGSQAEWARRNGIDRTYLNKVINGRKSAGPAILNALQIKEMNVYI